MKLNTKLDHIQASPIRAFNDQISTIEGLIPLTIGEPDFATPDFIKEAAIQAIEADKNGYSHSRGHLRLRQAIADFVKRKYQVDYKADTEIIVTSGPTQALLSTFLTLLNPGDKVLAASPNYVIYATQVQLAGGEFIPIDVSKEGFIFTPDLLEASLKDHPQTRVLLLNHPSNPTGVTYTKDQLQALIPVIEAHDLWVVSDEIYSELTYDQKHVSMAHLLPERTLLINGLSKSHAMTGWRSGFVAGPEWVINQLFKAHQATVNTPNTQMQNAAIIAYDQGDAAIEEMRQIYLDRRNFLMTAFKDLGIQTLNPQGAFYLFVKVPDWFEGDDFDFALALAQEARVGTVPGSGFGSAGKGYFRVSYAASMDSLKEAMNRIAQFVKTHQQ
ncbi:TPA: pyridoxal phosphate-dependent aminotransferase [Streptococcus suis]